MAERKPQLLMRRPRLDDLPSRPELPAGYALRLLREDEDKALAALLRSAFPEMTWSAETARKALIDAPDVAATYVVDHDGTPVATASARFMPDRFPGSGYLHWVGVHAEHRGRSFGALVTIRVLQHFKEAGCRDSVLETDDLRLPAIRLYLNLGYVPEYSDPSHPARWEKVLEQLGENHPLR